VPLLTAKIPKNRRKTEKHRTLYNHGLRQQPDLGKQWQLGGRDLIFAIDSKVRLRKNALQLLTAWRFGLKPIDLASRPVKKMPGRRKKAVVN
jgi:hypothetical protein